MPVPVSRIATTVIESLRSHQAGFGQKEKAIHQAIIEGLLAALEGKAIRSLGDFKCADVHGYSAYLDKLPAGIVEYLSTPAVTPLKTLSPALVKQAVQRIFSRWAAQANGLLKGADPTEKCTLGGWKAFEANGVMKLNDAEISEAILQKLPQDKRAVTEKIVRFLKDTVGSIQHNGHDDAKHDNEQTGTTFAHLLQQKVIDETEAKGIVAALIKETVQFEQAGEGTLVIGETLGKAVAIGLKEKWAVQNIGWHLERILPREGFKHDPKHNDSAFGVQMFRKGKQTLSIDRRKGVFLVSGKEASQLLANEIVKAFPKGVQLTITGHDTDNKCTVKAILTHTYSAKGIKLVVVQRSDGNFVLSPSLAGKTVKPNNAHAAMMTGAVGSTGPYSEGYTPFESPAPSA